MTQAIGRCRRYGQHKHVHVYHFLALSTIDVNIIQHRRQKVLIKRDGRFMLVDESNIDQKSDTTGWEGSPLEISAAVPDY
jgi:SNF2 family DNA or RNA helicase